MTQLQTLAQDDKQKRRHRPRVRSLGTYEGWSDDLMSKFGGLGCGRLDSPPRPYNVIRQIPP